HCGDGGLPQGLNDGPGDGESESAACEPKPKQSAAVRLAALDGADRPAEEPGRLLVRAAFQVAEHQGSTVLLRQPVYFLVKHGIPIEIVRPAEFNHAGRVQPGATRLVPAPADDRSPETGRRAAGDLVEPGAERVAHPERSRLAEQDEEGGLEGVFRLMLVAH